MRCLFEVVNRLYPLEAESQVWSQRNAQENSGTIEDGQKADY